MRKLIPDGFILALLATIAAATLFPATGIGADIADSSATVAVILLFFLHGARLARELVIAGLVHWRLHIAIFISTFVMFPAVGLGLSLAAPALLAPTLWVGVLFLASLPSTVQSSIAFTSIARGNVPAAIASASASQIVGVFLTPVLLALLVGATGYDMSLSAIMRILAMVLLPFMIGHLLRPWIGAWAERNRKLLSFTDRGTIILAVYSSFSESVVEGVWSRLPLQELLLLTVVMGLLLAIALLFTWMLGRVLGFQTADRIVVLFCGTKKSLVQGVPMGRILFPGPDLGLILLPILLFHQMQLMVCAAIARRLAGRRD